MLNLVVTRNGPVIRYQQGYFPPFFVGRDNYWARSSAVASPFANESAALSSKVMRELEEEGGYAYQGEQG